MSKNRLIIFGRYPEPGTTKTRMIPLLGPIGAAELQRILAERLVGVAKSAISLIEADLIFCHEGGNLKKMQKWLGAEGLKFQHQSTGDLGARMQTEFVRSFSSGAKKTILLGTDIDGLKSTHLVQAFSALNHHDLVLGPSTDGGYWLVGMGRLEPVFTDISWGTPMVLEQTLSLARQRGLTTFLLDPLSDLDTPEDLDKSRNRNLPDAPYLSAIIKVDNESERIKAVTGSAEDPDAEIIIVDGKSSGNTIEAAKTDGIRTLRSEHQIAVQFNKGALGAKGRVLLFLHGNSTLPKGYAAHIFNMLMNREVAMGTFQFNVCGNNNKIRLLESFTNGKSGMIRLPGVDQGFFIRKRSFIKNGGFPENPDYQRPITD